MNIETGFKCSVDFDFMSSQRILDTVKRPNMPWSLSADVARGVDHVRVLPARIPATSGARKTLSAMLMPHDSVGNPVRARVHLKADWRRVSAELDRLSGSLARFEANLRVSGMSEDEITAVMEKKRAEVARTYSGGQTRMDEVDDQFRQFIQTLRK